MPKIYHQNTKNTTEYIKNIKKHQKFKKTLKIKKYTKNIKIH